MKEFTCGACQKALSWQEELVGLEAECPFCGADITVPPAPGQTGGTIGIVEIGDSGVQPVAQTISSFLAERNLPGGVQLGDEGDSDSGLIDSLEAGGEQKYHVGERIAAGGMGAILDARDLNLKRRIAMKVMHHPDRVSESQLARFIEEAQVTGQLEHPSIVPVHELGIDAHGRPFYTMKLLKGRTLQAILEDLKEGGAGEAAEKTFEDWPLGKLLNAFARICEAMRYAHSKGVIHRDLKPENIMVGEFGEVQVLDWGLAKILGREETAVEDPDNDQVESVRSGGDSGRFLSMDGSIAGTPQYMAPEQANGKIKELDERTDVYALGAILYQILTLRAPVDGPTLQAILVAAAKGQVIPPEDLVTEPLPHCPNEKIPAALSAMAMKALAHDPAKRYQKVEDLTADLEKHQAGFATEAEEAGTWRQAQLFLRRHKTIAIGSTLLLAAILAGSAISLVQRNRAVAAQARAEKALADKAAAEQTKREQAKASAPAFLTAAKSLIVNGDYSNALVSARQAADYDPGLVQAHLVEAYLQAEAGKTNEALTAAQAAVETDDHHRQAINSARSLQEWSEGDQTALSRLAPSVRQSGLHQLATLIDNRGTSDLAERYKDKLPEWRRQIDQAQPGYGKNLTIGKWGLHFEAGGFQKMKALKGIPINSFFGRGVVDLSPLAGAPLRSIEVHGPKILNLESAINPQLTWLHCILVSEIPEFNWQKLCGNKFSYIALPHYFPTALYPKLKSRCIECNPIHLSHVLKVQGLESIRLHGVTCTDFKREFLAVDSSVIITSRGLLASGDTLHLSFGANTARQVLDDIDGAINSISNESNWAEWFRYNFELMRYFIMHQQGEAAELPESQHLQVVGDRVFAVVDDYLVRPKVINRLGYEFASIHTEAENQAAVELLKSAKLDGDSWQPDVVIGAVRTSNGWGWLDGSPWDFEKLLTDDIRSLLLTLGKTAWLQLPENFYAHPARWLVSWPLSGPDKVEWSQPLHLHSFHEHRYIMWPEPLDWKAAESFAERLNGQLAIMDSDDELAFIGSHVREYVPLTFGYDFDPRRWHVVCHLGARRERGKNFKWLNGDNADIISGKSTKTENPEDNIITLRMSGEAKPTNESFTKCASLIEWDDPSLVPDNLDQSLANEIQYSTGESTYILVHGKPLNWHDAKNAAEARGGHLASITSVEEFEFIQKRFHHLVPFWLGATDEEEEGEWKWVSSEPWEPYPEEWFGPNGFDNSNGKEHYLKFAFHKDANQYWLNDLPKEVEGAYLIELKKPNH